MIPVRINIRPLLIPGLLCTDKRDDSVHILISDSLDENEMCITLWHEAIHLLMMAAGIPAEVHNEFQIEACARKLADACPEILDMCNISAVKS